MRAAVWDEKMSPRHCQVAFYTSRLQQCISERNLLGSLMKPSQWKTLALGAALRSADCWGLSSPSSCPHLRAWGVHHTSSPHFSLKGNIQSFLPQALPVAVGLSHVLWWDIWSCLEPGAVKGHPCPLLTRATLQCLLLKSWHQYQIQSILSIIFTGDWFMTER